MGEQLRGTGRPRAGDFQDEEITDERIAERGRKCSSRSRPPQARLEVQKRDLKLENDPQAHKRKYRPHAVEGIAPRVELSRLIRRIESTETINAPDRRDQDLVEHVHRCSATSRHRAQLNPKNKRQRRGRRRSSAEEAEGPEGFIRPVR